MAIGTNENAEPTILVVDDEALVRLVIAEHLRDCGFRVLEAGSADEAQGLMRAAGRAINLVFSDVQMPGGMDGLGLAHWIRRERPDVLVILTSGLVRLGSDSDSLCLDAPLVEKPYRSNEVEQSIRSALAQRSSESRRAADYRETYFGGLGAR